MNRLVAPRDRHAAASKAGAANEASYDKAGVLRRRLWTPSLKVLRAFQDCRAGFAGRDMQGMRATERSTLASGADPRRSLGSAS